MSPVKLQWSSGSLITCVMPWITWPCCFSEGPVRKDLDYLIIYPLPTGTCNVLIEQGLEKMYKTIH